MNDDFCSRMTPSFAEGVLLAVNSISDAALAVEGPACARSKMERICRNHDLQSTLYSADGKHRMATTDRGPARVMGSLDAIREICRSMLRELEPSALFLLPFAPQQAMGMDLDSVAKELRANTSANIVPLESRALEGDWLDGWADVFTALAGLVDTPAVKPSGSVSIVGLMHTRNEGDDLGNAAELTRLVECLGLEVAGIWASGGPVQQYLDACSGDILVALPHAAGFAQQLAEKTGATLVEAPLPLGIQGTTDFVRTMGGASGRGAEAEALAATETARCTAKLTNLVSLLADEISVAVLADPVLAPALHRALGEVGIEVPLTGVLSAHKLPDDVSALAGSVVPDPSFVGWAKSLGEAAAKGVQVAVGCGLTEVAAHKAGLEVVELGYPCHKTHFLTPAPYLGFSGFLRLIERLANAHCGGVAKQRLDASARRVIPE